MVPGAGQVRPERQGLHGPRAGDGEDHGGTGSRERSVSVVPTDTGIGVLPKASDQEPDLESRLPASQDWGNQTYYYYCYYY